MCKQRRNCVCYLTSCSSGAIYPPMTRLVTVVSQALCTTPLRPVRASGACPVLSHLLAIKEARSDKRRTDSPFVSFGRPGHAYHAMPHVRREADCFLVCKKKKKKVHLYTWVARPAGVPFPWPAVYVRADRGRAWPTTPESRRRQQSPSSRSQGRRRTFPQSQRPPHGRRGEEGGSGSVMPYLHTHTYSKGVQENDTRARRVQPRPSPPLPPSTCPSPRRSGNFAASLNGTKQSKVSAFPSRSTPTSSELCGKLALRPYPPFLLFSPLTAQIRVQSLTEKRMQKEGGHPDLPSCVVLCLGSQDWISERTEQLGAASLSLPVRTHGACAGRDYQRWVAHTRLRRSVE